MNTAAVVAIPTRRNSEVISITQMSERLLKTLRKSGDFQVEYRLPSHYVAAQAAASNSNLRWLRVPCAVQGGAFQWVQVPPGIRSSRKQPEQAWR